jgi:hypothetical protein
MLHRKGRLVWFPDLGQLGMFVLLNGEFHGIITNRPINPDMLRASDLVFV